MINETESALSKRGGDRCHRRGAGTILLTFGGLLSFFAFGFIDNLKGSLLPEVLSAERLNYAQGAGLLLAAYLGFILATLVTGFAADRIGNARLLWIAAVALIVGPLGFGLPGGLVWIASLMFVIGLGLGTIEVAANGLMLDLHPNAPGRYLNLLATCHGVGALAVPLVAAKLVTMGFAWEAVYIGVVVLALPLLLLFSGSVSRRSVSSRGVYCERNIGGSADGSASDASSQSVAIRTPWRSTLRSCFTPLMCGYYFAIACYVAVELGVGAWAMEYSQREEGLTAVQSSYLLSGFFAMIMAGRFLGAWVVDRLSFVTIVCVALALGVACLTAALFGSFGAYWPFEAYWLLALSGLFFSVVFPTITAHVAAMHDQARGAVMGLLFTFGGIGGAVGPAVVGYVAQWTNLRTGLATTIVFGLASLVTMLVISMLSSAFSASPRFKILIAEGIQDET